MSKYYGSYSQYLGAQRCCDLRGQGPQGPEGPVGPAAIGERGMTGPAGMSFTGPTGRGCRGPTGEPGPATYRGVPVTKTSDFAVGTTENWIICNGSAPITVTLPSASTYSARELMFKNLAAQSVVSDSSNVVPLASDIAGTSILPATIGSTATLVSDGTNWITMQYN